jgi:FAD/FMN-containing dehydrogenase
MEHEQGLTRRRALGLLAGATVSTAAGCSSSGSPSPPSARRPSSARPVPSVHSTPFPRPPTAREARALRRKIAGDVLLPDDDPYAAARLLFDRRFDTHRPTVIAQVAEDGDIGHCLDLARTLHLPVAIRSGGHSYIGASIGSGMVIDLRRLAGVAVNQGGTATVGAGAALVDVYSGLSAHGVSIPAGTCPTVGLSGLTLGGGVGVVVRRYGLTCDRLIEARVVTADGNVVTCDAAQDPDLFWALRGGGGSFGVVTSMTFHTHAADPLAHAYLAWPWPAAADVVKAWQPWAAAAPRALWSSAQVVATLTAGPPTVLVLAAMVGSTTSLQQHIGDLLQAVPPPTTNFVTSESYAATMMLEANCSSLTVQQCHVGDETAAGTLPRDAFVAGSDFFHHQIPDRGIDALVAAVAHRQADPRLGAGGASLDILGGAIDDVAPDATAWVHRGALFNAQYTASWGTATNTSSLARNQHSLAKIHNAVRRYATGEAYQNYADDSLPDPLRAYYGRNLPKLIEIRRTYDPGGVFTQPQGVPLS